MATHRPLGQFVPDVTSCRIFHHQTGSQRHLFLYRLSRFGRERKRELHLALARLSVGRLDGFKGEFRVFIIETVRLHSAGATFQRRLAQGRCGAAGDAVRVAQCTLPVTVALHINHGVGTRSHEDILVQFQLDILVERDIICNRCSCYPIAITRPISHNVLQLCTQCLFYPIHLQRHFQMGFAVISKCLRHHEESLALSREFGLGILGYLLSIGKVQGEVSGVSIRIPR